MERDQLVLSWSGGKDSSLALHRLLNEKKYKVKYLLTTVTKEFDRISMHGVRRELLLEQARKTSIDPRKLRGEFAGREFDEDFISSVPEAVDPCGENGEFHTFVYDGPIYSSPIPIKKGETVIRDNFYFADILPV